MEINRLGATAKRLADPNRSASAGGRLLAAALLVWIGWIHLHLWQGGYSHIHVIGPLFLANFVIAIVGALAILFFPARFLPLPAAAAALFAIGTFAGFLVSVNIGLFGFKDSVDAPFAAMSMGVELATFVVCAALAALTLRGLLSSRDST